jgi:hypothetical protein
MPLPDTFASLAERGYRHAGSARCRGCGRTIEWFWTPNNRRMPFSLKMEMHVSETDMYALASMTRYEPHFASCPKAETFRRKKREAK